MKPHDISLFSLRFTIPKQTYTNDDKHRFSCSCYARVVHVLEPPANADLAVAKDVPINGPVSGHGFADAAPDLGVLVGILLLDGAQVLVPSHNLEVLSIRLCGIRVEP